MKQSDGLPRLGLQAKRARSDPAAVETAWRRSLARGVCAMNEWVCLAAVVLVYAKDFNAALHALCRPGDRI